MEPSWKKNKNKNIVTLWTIGSNQEAGARITGRMGQRTVSQRHGYSDSPSQSEPPMFPLPLCSVQYCVSWQGHKPEWWRNEHIFAITMMLCIQVIWGPRPVRYAAVRRYSQCAVYETRMSLLNWDLVLFSRTYSKIAEWEMWQEGTLKI